MFAGLYVKLICLRKMIDHCAGPWRPPDSERMVSSEEPSSEPEIRNAHDMVGVQVGQEKCVDFIGRFSCVAQTDYSAPSAIEQQFLASRLDQNRRPKALNIRKWGASAEERHSNDVCKVRLSG